MLDIEAVERVIDKRTERGATDEQIIAYLEKLKAGSWKKEQRYIDELIDAVKQTPLKP